MELYSEDESFDPFTGIDCHKAPKRQKPTKTDSTPVKKRKKSDSTETPSKKKRKVKKVKKNAFKDVIVSLTVDLNDRWYIKTSSNYMVFSPFGKNAPIECIGIDVGTKHLGICGLARLPGYKRPVCTWLSLLTSVESSLHHNADVLSEILFRSLDFGWFRIADIYKIEQQVGMNNKARAFACVLRVICSSFHYQRERPKDVEYVHGEWKYQIAPLYCKESLKDPLRIQMQEGSISSSQGTLKRKILGKNDTLSLLKENSEHETIDFLQYFSIFVDQLYDMTDSYLIARTNYENDLKITRKRKSKEEIEEELEQESD
jgi:hypothetical protein